MTSRIIRIFLLFNLTIIILGINSCGIYSFKGISLSPDVETVAVSNFQNTANQVVPLLSENMTETFKDKLMKELNLSLVDFDSHIAFKGTITNYSVGTASVTSNQQAGTSRLTMTVKVEYDNYEDPDADFESSFTSFIDFSSSEDFNSLQSELNEELIEMIIQDIFNRAFNNW